MKKLFFFIIIFLMGLFFLFLFFQEQRLNSRGKVCLEQNCFFVELAIKEKDIQKGLMQRQYLGEKEGMLFVFEKEDIYPFWMKNTLIPLDIIWINNSKEVVFISKDNQPCLESFCAKITPNRRARYVLEINAGSADKINLEVGDKLIFEINGN